MSTITVLIVLVMTGVVAVLALRRFWDVGRPTQVAQELVARLLMNPLGSPRGFVRALHRRVVAESLVLPSGGRVVPGRIELRHAPEDAEMIAGLGGPEAVASDLADAMVDHGERRGWRLLVRPQVVLIEDPVIRPGRVGAVRVTAPVAGAEQDPVDGTEGGTELLLPPDLTEPMATAPVTDLRLVVDGTVHAVVSTPLAVGRGLEGWSLDDPTVSYVHAIVELGHDGWSVRDAGSTNGTRVDGILLAQGQSRLLQDGDTVRIGATEVRVVIGEGAGR